MRGRKKTAVRRGLAGPLTGPDQSGLIFAACRPFCPCSLYFKLDPLILCQGLEAFARDVAKVRGQVGATAILGDEAIPLLSLNHFTVPVYVVELNRCRGGG